MDSEQDKVDELIKELQIISLYPYVDRTREVMTELYDSVEKKMSALQDQIALLGYTERVKVLLEHAKSLIPKDVVSGQDIAPMKVEDGLPCEVCGNRVWNYNYKTKMACQDSGCNVTLCDMFCAKKHMNRTGHKSDRQRETDEGGLFVSQFFGQSNV
jgi:hypothetical protein